MKLVKKAVVAVLLLCFCALYAAAQFVPPPKITKDAGGKPNWVNRSDAAYDNNFYVSATGYGDNRQLADSSAFGNLTAFLGQSVQSNIAVVESYKEKVSGGAVTVESGLETEQAIALSASMDQLIGAEINDRWYDEKTKIYYAAAIMEKPRTITLYGELIDGNLKSINTMLNIPAAEKATFDAMAKYQLAASLADTNGVFATVLSLLGGPNRKNDLKTGDDYRYEAANIAKLIPVNVVVEGDTEGRIRNAFSEVFTKAGFRTGNNRSRYVMNVKITVSPVEMKSPNKFSRYVVDASLVDTADNTVLIPYSINGREGHATQPEADVRAIRAAENTIKSDFAEKLAGYLSSATS